MNEREKEIGERRQEPENRMPNPVPGALTSFNLFPPSSIRPPVAKVLKIKRFLFTFKIKPVKEPVF